MSARVLAWLPPRLRAERLRRLQLAAQAHDGPAFVLRELAAQQRPTAAPLRLALRPAGADRLELRLLKRRGPPLDTPLLLELPPVLSEHRAPAVPARPPCRPCCPTCRRRPSSTSAELPCPMLWIALHLPRLSLESFIATLPPPDPEADCAPSRWSTPTTSAPPTTPRSRVA
jgi:hypothetical protein